MLCHNKRNVAKMGRFPQFYYRYGDIITRMTKTASCFSRKIHFLWHVCCALKERHFIVLQLFRILTKYVKLMKIFMHERESGVGTV
jgi:hypothetical protein